MSKTIDDYILQKINERIEANALRTLNPNNPKLIDFCSNDYLGFARNSLIHNNVEEQLKQLKITNGGTGARTITGTTALIANLESYLADFFNTESTLFYNSGYTANLGLFSSLPYRGDTIIYDELIHASIQDGITMSRANAFSFKHNNLNSLETRLKKAKGKVYVAVESIYSMDGDIAPLVEISELCTKYSAALIVDEAHSTGVFGKQGQGLVHELGLEKKVFARVMTFGKAIGSHGAVIACSKHLKIFLVNYSRPFIYTTAPPPHTVLSVKTAFETLENNANIILELKQNITFINSLLSDLNLEVIASDGPILCLLIPGNNKVKKVCKRIQNKGYDVRPIVAPTVPKGKERMRICLHAFNTKKEILGLVNALNM